LERFVMNTFDKFTAVPSDARIVADAAFMNALRARASTLVDVRFLVFVDERERHPRVTHICWSRTLEFVAGCRRDTGAGASRLRTVTVSFAVLTLDEGDEADLHGVLDVAEHEALAVLHPSVDELRMLPGTPRLFLHAYFRLHGDDAKGLVREILHGQVDSADPW
jgi:hypothetical protein